MVCKNLLKMVSRVLLELMMVVVSEQMLPDCHLIGLLDILWGPLTGVALLQYWCSKF